MTRTAKMMIGAAALTGLLAGSSSTLLAATSAPAQRAGVSAKTQVDNAGRNVTRLDDADKGKHSCKGKNGCKGEGGCKSGDNGCKGKNSCKGKGGCNTEKPAE